MFFIIILLIIILIIILAFAFKIKAVINADNGNINVSVHYLFIRIKRRYVVIYDESTLFTLYLIKKKGLKKVITLTEALKKITATQATDIKFIDLITVITQSFKKNEKSAFYYIHKKIRYNLEALITLGLDDAFLTAMGCGLLSAAAGAACALTNTQHHILRVKAFPEFSKLFFSIDANCIIAITPADIIIGYAVYKINKRR